MACLCLVANISFNICLTVGTYSGAGGVDKSHELLGTESTILIRCICTLHLLNVLSRLAVDLMKATYV